MALLATAVPVILIVSLLKQQRPQLAENVAPRSKEDDAFFVHLALDAAEAISARAFPPT